MEYPLSCLYRTLLEIGKNFQKKILENKICIFQFFFVYLYPQFERRENGYENI